MALANPVSPGLFLFLIRSRLTTYRSRSINLTEWQISMNKMIDD